MSTFTFNIYLVQDIDGDGSNDFVLHDDGRIVLETRAISVDTSYRYIGGQIAARSRPALSFAVRKRPNGQWYLMTNQQTFCGIYDSQAACIGVLYGIYTHFDGEDLYFTQWIADALEKGSIIDPDENILALRDNGIGSSPRLSFDATQLGDGDQWQIMFMTSLDGVTFVKSTQAPVLNTEGLVSLWLSGDLVNQDVPEAFFTNVPENSYFKLQLFDPNEETYGNSSEVFQKDDTENTNLVFEIQISGDDEDLVPITAGGRAYYLVDDSGSTLDPGETITYDQMWYRQVPSLTGITVTNLGGS